MSPPKERKRDKIGRKLGNLVDRIGGIKKEEVSIDEGKKKGLWDRIHAKRKRGERPARPGEKDYPKTLNVEGTDTPVPHQQHMNSKPSNNSWKEQLDKEVWEELRRRT